MGAGVQVPTYAGDIALRLQGSGAAATAVQGFVPTRDRSLLSWFSIDRPAGAPPTLRCAEGPGAVREAGKTQRCDPAHLVNASPDGSLTVGSDPFGVAISGGGTEPTFVHVASMGGGSVSLFRLNDKDQSAPVLETTRTFAAGLHSVGVSASGRAYVSDNYTNIVFAYDVVESEDVTPTTLPLPGHALQPGDPLTIPSGATGDFGRGIAFNADRTVMYVAFGSPSQVVVVDVSLDELGVPRNQILATIGLGRTPSVIAAVPQPGGAGDRLYVTCMRSNDIWVVDVPSRQVIDVLPLASRPYGLAWADVPGVGRRLYAAVFEWHRVAAIDIDPTSAYFHQVVAYLR
jgi:YVTN family beta-propeller protein